MTSPEMHHMSELIEPKSEAVILFGAQLAMRGETRMTTIVDPEVNI